MLEFALTTDPGLEDCALEELQGLMAPHPVVGEIRPFGLPGHLHIRMEASEEQCLAWLRQMRSIHRVVRLVAHLNLPTEGAVAYIRQQIAALSPQIPEFAREEASFRVSSTRVGKHDFSSEDVAREAGAGVRDVLARKVRLRDYDVELRCDVRGSICLVGIQMPGPALSRRERGPFRPSVTLRPSTAWGLLHLARANPRHLLDPFAGAGTILLEAAAQWPNLKLYGSDMHPRAVAGLHENMAYAELTERVEIRQGDARHLEQVWPGKQFDTIVTNPPFGRRLGKEANLDALYRLFLQSAAQHSTPDARLVILAEARAAFNRALLHVPAWQTVHVRIIEMGGVYVGVFVLERRPTMSPPHSDPDSATMPTPEPALLDSDLE